MMRYKWALKPLYVGHWDFHLVFVYFLWYFFFRFACLLNVFIYLLWMLSSATAREGSKINKSYVRNLITDFRTIRRQIPSDLSLMQLPLWRGPPTRPKNSTALGFRPAILYLSSPSPPPDAPCRPNRKREERTEKPGFLSGIIPKSQG